jgi:hypothetical protein
MSGRRKFGNGCKDVTDVTDVRTEKEVRKKEVNGCNGCQEEGSSATSTVQDNGCNGCQEEGRKSNYERTNSQVPIIRLRERTSKSQLPIPITNYQ